MGIPDVTKIPKSIQIVIAQLAFGNSDLAFEGNHLFQGNFYGMSIFDIGNPAKPSLTTTMICPGGQGDVSVYKIVMFMSVEMPNGRIDCGTEGFPPEAPSTDAKDKDKGPMDRKPAAQKERFRGVRIFDISNIANPKQVAAVQPAAAHTLTRWSSIPTIRTTSTSTFQALPSSASPKKSPAAPMKRRTKIPTPRSSAST